MTSRTSAMVTGWPRCCVVRKTRSADDTYLWAAIQFLADRLADNDPDAVALTRVLRTRTAIGNAADAVAATNSAKARRQKDDQAQLKLI
jgi:putative DNA methylase